MAKVERGVTVTCAAGQCLYQQAPQECRLGRITLGPRYLESERCWYAYCVMFTQRAPLTCVCGNEGFEETCHGEVVVYNVYNDGSSHTEDRQGTGEYLCCSCGKRYTLVEGVFGYHYLKPHKEEEEEGEGN